MLALNESICKVNYHKIEINNGALGIFNWFLATVHVFQLYILFLFDINGQLNQLWSKDSACILIPSNGDSTS